MKISPEQFGYVVQAIYSMGMPDLTLRVWNAALVRLRMDTGEILATREQLASDAHTLPRHVSTAMTALTKIRRYLENSSRPACGLQHQSECGMERGRRHPPDRRQRSAAVAAGIKSRRTRSTVMSWWGGLLKAIRRRDNGVDGRDRNCHRRGSDCHWGWCRAWHWHDSEGGNTSIRRGGIDR